MLKTYLRRLLMAAAVLTGGLNGLQAQLANEGTSYTLRIDGTEYYLSAETAAAGADAELTMQEAGAAGFDQSFVFTATANGYYVTVGNDMVLVRESWYMRYKNSADVNTDSNDATFVIEASGSGIQLKNLGSGKYIGCDNLGAGKKLYSDKTGDAVCVFIAEVFSDDIYKEKLTTAIAEAEELLAGTESGNEPGQYPESARQAFARAIADARRALEGNADEIKAAINSLGAAVETFGGQRIPLPFTTGNYRFAFKGISGAYLSNGWHANSWESSNKQPTGLFLPENTSGYNQQYKVSRTAPDAAVNGYNICDKNGCYLYNRNGALLYDDSKTLDPRSRDAVFFFEPDGDYVRIVSAATGHYVGPNDNSKGWSWIHAGTDYTGEADGCLYTAEFLGVDHADLLAELIADATALLDTTTEGSDAGQYPAEARRDLADAIAAAETVLQGGDTDAMENAMNELDNAISTYKDSVIKASFAEGVYKFHHCGVDGAVLASGWHANSWESSNVENTALIVAQTDAASYNTEFTVKHSPATAAEDGYNILDKNGNPLVNSNGKLLVGSTTALDDTNALFAFEENDGLLRIRSLATGKNVGPVDGTKGWSWIHAGTNHTGTDDGDVFTKEFIRETTGVAETATDNTRVSVISGNGTLTVLGAKSAVICDVAGRCAAATTGDATINLRPGIYVVAIHTAAGVTSVKTIVK